MARSDGVEVLGEDLQLPLDAAGYSRRACPRCKAAPHVLAGDAPAAPSRAAA